MGTHDGAAGVVSALVGHDAVRLGACSAAISRIIKGF